MDADKIKGFFVNHVEKMVLALVILVSGYLMYSGTKLENFQEANDPDQLKTKANQVKSDIDIDHTAEVMKERDTSFDIVAETKRVDTAVAFDDYKLRTWEGGGINKIVKRSDPALVAPEAVRVVPVVTSIARRSPGEADDYFLASLEAADEVERIEKPKPRERRRRGRNMMMGDEYGGGMDDMMGGMDEGYGMEEDYGSDMMGMMDGATTGVGGPIRRFDAKKDHGMRPTATEDKANPVPAVGMFIAGTAVVPHKQLHENYKMAFMDADQYEARRDAPLYYDIQVARADVTDKSVDQLADADWVIAGKDYIWDRELYTMMAARFWSGFAPEIVPSDYRDDALTMWIPPVLLDDYRPFATHPMIPMLSKRDLEREANAEDGEEVELQEFSMENDDDSIGLVAPGAGPSSSMGGMMGMEDYGMEMGDDYGGEMDGMMGMMGAAMFGRGALEVDPVEYKLIRFYDFAGFKKSPQLGRKYVYRVRYAVNDPNFPFAQSLQPKVSSLTPDVADRVQEKMTQAVRTNVREFRRWSEWSQPTEAVSLPTTEQYFAGPVDRGSINIWNVRGKPVEYSKDSPKAKIIASQYDFETGARIPMPMEVKPGTVLSHKAETADVVDPITLEVKKLPEAEIVSGTTVVDIDGGRPLQIGDDLKSPGLMLIFDQSGKLKVSSEVGDMEMYRTYSYADERGE